jgi:hypothetical protein
LEKPEENRPLGRPRCRWVDNIKMDLLEIGWGGVDWIGLAQVTNKWRALVNAVMNLRFHKMLGMCLPETGKEVGKELVQSNCCS